MNWAVVTDVLFPISIVVVFLTARKLFKRVRRLESQHHHMQQLLELARRARQPSRCSECGFSGTRESVLMHKLQEHLT